MKKLSNSIKTGLIALVFLIIGFETASFIGKTLDESVQAEESGQSDQNEVVPLTDSVAYSRVERKREAETFDFNPNTATLEDFQRLGLSEKQAQSILNYRSKGGKFRRREDFARSYVVSEALYERLKDHIIIPLIDINAADSAEFDSLPGIGPYFAARMVEYRSELQGYSYKEQLMDIWNFDDEKFRGLEDLIEVGESAPFRLWSLPEDSLSLHPYISRHAAHSIVLYRENTPTEEWSVSNLLSAGILSPENAAKLSKCRLE